MLVFLPIVGTNRKSPVPDLKPRWVVAHLKYEFRFVVVVVVSTNWLSAIATVFTYLWLVTMGSLVVISFSVLLDRLARIIHENARIRRNSLDG